MDENDITYQIRGAIFKVYNTFSPGLLESVYEKALVYELNKQGLSAKSQVMIPVKYDGVNLDAELRADIIVEDKVIIELKAVDELHKVYYKQLSTYLKLTGLRAGLLVNFNEYDMAKGIHRIINGDVSLTPKF